MSTQHTPGPWRVEPDLPDYRIYSPGGHAPIARAFNPDNARLIAAAPMLLESLEKMVALSHHAGGILDDAKAAIRAAKGESNG